MQGSNEGELPAIVRALFPAVGAFPLGIGLTLAVRRLARRRPHLFDRLGQYRTARFLIVPSDLAFAFLVIPDNERSVVNTVSVRCPVACDVTVRGPLLMLIGLLDGTLDGDALFFHRVISVEGRTDALLALRNAMDAATLRPADLLGLEGRAGQVADRGVEQIVGLLRRFAGATSSEAG